MKMPRVSIVVPVYNKASFVRETLQSALSQDYGHLELVVVDDGSTDDSVPVIQETLRNATVPCRLIRKKNGGVSEARNVGISAASGDIVCALDADDVIHSSYISVAVQALEDHSVNLVSCSVDLGEKGEWHPEAYDPYVERYHNVIPSLVTYRKDVWRTVGGYDVAFPFNEDWNFFVAAEQVPLRVTRLEGNYFSYRVLEAGLAERFIKDTWQWSVAQVVLAQSDKYPCEKIVEAIERMSAPPERWSEAFKSHSALHPASWLLHLWLGLSARKMGNIDDAYERLQRAVRLTTSWLPRFVLAQLAQTRGMSDEAQILFHEVRLMRPDMERYVVPEIRAIKNSTK